MDITGCHHHGQTDNGLRCQRAIRQQGAVQGNADMHTNTVRTPTYREKLRTPCIALLTLQVRYPDVKRIATSRLV